MTIGQLRREEYGYKLLWAAVLGQALEDLTSERKRLRIAARILFYSPNRRIDLEFMCSVLGLDVDKMLERAREIEAVYSNTDRPKSHMRIVGKIYKVHRTQYELEQANA